jgi:ABC-type branched-subunit amino acid transport system substrate-binding protein
MLRLLLRLALPLAALLTGPVALAQGAGPAPVRVTVIVSELGVAAARGRLERTVAEAWAQRLAVQGGVYGRPVDVEVVDDGGRVARAQRLADAAIEGGVHALVCCSTAAASAALGPHAADAGVPLLSPAGAGADGATGWQVALSPGDATELQAVVRDVHARGLHALGVMAPATDAGDRALARLEGFLAAPELRVVGTARYAADADALTPEALWVATRQPDAILVWGGRRDGGRAVAGLRARGWTGPAYLPSAILDPLAGGLPPGLRGDVRVAVSPATVPNAGGPTEPGAGWRMEVRALSGGPLESRRGLADAAILHDALELVRRAVAEAEVYGVQPEETRGYRLALRDALVAVPPATLAAGRYDPAMDRVEAALAEGLRIARVEHGRLLPLP